MRAKVREYREVERRFLAACRRSGIKVRRLGRVGAERYPLYFAESGPRKPALRVLISAGIHGDEPAGVEAVLRLLEERFFLRWPELHFILFPCNNPIGYEHDRRRNSGRFDLNRQYAAQRPPEEVRLIKRALKPEQYDLSVELHEDIDTPGFYLYELGEGGPSIGDAIVRRVAEKFPLNRRREIEGFPARNGVIRPMLERAYLRRRVAGGRCPQSVYLFLNGTRRCITSETPTTLPLDDRAEIHRIVLQSALSALTATSLG